MMAKYQVTHVRVGECPSSAGVYHVLAIGTEGQTWIPIAVDRAISAGDHFFIQSTNGSAEVWTIECPICGAYHIVPRAKT